MKHNVMKRTLAGVMAVLTVAAYMPANVGGFLTEGNGIGIVASAEGELQVVDTAAAFKAAVEAGTSVKLTADITLTSTVNVTKDVTIDLNGYNITATDARAIFVKSGSLILTGAGMISSTTSTPEFDDKNHFESTSSVIRVGENNTTEAAALNVGSSVIVSSDWCYGVTIFGKNNGKTVDISGTVSVTGKQCAVSGNGTAGYGGTTINIFEGATITAENDVAIYHPQAGTMNITGGTITGLGGIEAKAGTSNVSISGDNTVITATNGSLHHKANGNGTSTKGYAIVAVENSGYAGAPTFNITGGTINGAVDVLSDNEVSSDKEGVINITGGNFIINVSDDNYALKSDVTVDSLTIANGVDATIDLNGHDLNLIGKVYVGSVESSAESTASLSFINSNSMKDGGKINATTGTYSASDWAMCAYGYSTLTIGANVDFETTADYGIYYRNNSTLNVYGSVSSTGKAAISGNGNNPLTDPEKSNSYMSTLNIYDGASVSCTNGNAIYHPQYGTVNISGGSVSSGKTAIYQRAGTINITGGSFSGNGEANAPGTVANGASPTGDAIAVQAFTGSYMSLPELNISGGDFFSVNADAIGSYTYKSNGLYPTVSITGGYFSSDVSAYVAPGYYQDNGTVKSDERTDISNAKITVKYDDKNRNSSFTYNIYQSHNINEYGFTVKVGDTILTEHEDFEIYEGDTEANLVGTYVFKIRGIGDYKGTAVGNWSISDNHTITVYHSNDTFYQSKNTSYGKAVTVTAPSGIWNDCMCWKAYNTVTNDWDIVSYSESYSFIALKDVTLKYDTYRTGSEEVVSDKSVLTMTTSQTKYGGNNAVKFTFNRNIDTKYTVKEVGVLYGTNKLAGADTSKPGYLTANLLTQGDEYGITDLAESLKSSNKIKKFVASSKNYNGTVEFSYGVGSNVSYYTDAIGYVIVRDKETGKISTLYSNPVSASYNSAV